MPIMAAPRADASLPTLACSSSASSSSRGSAGGRRTLRKSCDACYRRKVRCDFDSVRAVCTGCIHRKLPCTFGLRKERISKGGDASARQERIAAVEAKLQKIDAILEAAGIVYEEDAQVFLRHDKRTENADFSDSNCTQERNALHLSKDAILSVSNLSTSNQNSGASTPVEPDLKPVKQTCPVTSLETCQTTLPALNHVVAGEAVTDHSSPASTRQRDSDSAFLSDTIAREFSPEVAKRVVQPSQPANYLESLSIILNRQKEPDGSPGLEKLFDNPPIPPLQDVLPLVKDYFKLVNRLIPLYHELAFMKHLDAVYAHERAPSAPLMASIHTMSAMKYSFCTSQNPLVIESEQNKGRYHFRIASSMLPHLMLVQSDLLSIQAMIGMALYLTSYAALDSALPLITAALRAAYATGLHKQDGTNADDVKQRRRVFWIAQILEHRACLRTGTSPMQCLDDFETSVIDDSIWLDGWPMTNNKAPPFFQSLGSLTIITSRALRALYSPKGIDQSGEKLYPLIQNLNQQLREWKESMSRDTDVFSDECTHLPKMAIISIRLMYYHTVMLINRVPMVLEIEKPEALPAPATEFQAVQNMMWSSHSMNLCGEAARATIQMTTSFKTHDLVGVWSLLQYFFKAAMCIFTEVINDAGNPACAEDIIALGMARNFFSALVVGTRGVPGRASLMYKYCTGFERIATNIVMKNAIQNSQVHYTQYQGLKSLGTSQVGLNQPVLGESHTDYQSHMLDPLIDNWNVGSFNFNIGDGNPMPQVPSFGMVSERNSESAESSDLEFPAIGGSWLVSSGQS